MAKMVYLFGGNITEGKAEMKKTFISGMMIALILVVVLSGYSGIVRLTFSYTTLLRLESH